MCLSNLRSEIWSVSCQSHAIQYILIFVTYLLKRLCRNTTDEIFAKSTDGGETLANPYNMDCWVTFNPTTTQHDRFSKEHL